MADRIPEIPSFWLIAALSLAALAVDLAILLVSRARLARQKSARRRAEGGDWQAIAALKAPSRLPEIIAVLMPLAVAVTAARVIQGARNLLVTALGEVDPTQRARLAVRALNELLNATAMGLWVVPPVVLVGGVAVAAAISARLRARGLVRAGSLAVHADQAGAWLKFPGPRTDVLVATIGAFLVLGFGPIARSGFEAIRTTILHFAATAGLAWEKTGAILNEGLDDASRVFDQSFVVARAGIAIAALIGAFLAWRFSPGRARARLLGGSGRPAPRDGAVGLVIALGTIALAIAGFLAARPLRQENQLAWPAYEGGDWLMPPIATPELDGPDRLERAPIIHVTPGRIGLDGHEADGRALAREIDTMHRDSRGDQVLVVCQADTPIHRLDDALRAAVSGGMPRATFVFSKRQLTDRPLFGNRWRKRARAARTTTIDNRADAAPGAATIPLGRFETCAALAQEIVAVRRAGREVALLLRAP